MALFLRQLRCIVTSTNFGYTVSDCVRFNSVVSLRIGNMVITSPDQLPSEEELTVPELNLSWPILQAAAFHVGKSCEAQNNEFMLCRQEEKDPRRCIQEGKEVTACAYEFFKKLKKNCKSEFLQYVNCLERSSGSLELSLCRKTQAVLDKCVLDKMNIERPPFGYFTVPKIVDTKRPKPKEEELLKFPDATPFQPAKDKEYPRARFGTRYFWTGY